MTLCCNGFIATEERAGLQEEALEQEWGVGAMAANPDEHIPDSDETQRLAIVDLDWDKIRAVDILAVLRSFLAKGQSIKAVTVYPSDFGLEKMKEEAAIGPQVKISCLVAVEHAQVDHQPCIADPVSKTGPNVEPMMTRARH